jgi:uncharacterized integral membrane protein
VADGRDPQPPRSETNWRAWGLAVLVVLVIIFIALNSQRVTVDFLFFDASMPLIFALLITTVLGIVIGYVGPIVRRHRRERSE